MTLLEVTGLLAEKKKTVCVAESCTGGLLSETLTRMRESSRFFIAGLVVYANRAKSQLLHINPEILKRYGAVSNPVARLLANRARKLFHADFGIGITGIAGPMGGTRQKPVGTVYIAVADAKAVVVKKYKFSGSRNRIRHQAAQAALSLLYQCLKKH